MKKVITFGEIMLRLGAPDYLRLTQCNHLDMSFAGAEANVAVSLANYGIPVDYITRLPENPIADKCIRELLSYRVGTDKILRGGKRIGVLYLETGSNARPSRVFYDREDSAIATIPEHSIDWKKVFADATWFHWTGITPAISENAARACLEAIKVANEMKERVQSLTEQYNLPIDRMPLITTYHSFCLRFLRKEISYLPGFTKNFTIADDDDQKKYLKMTAEALKINVKADIFEQAPVMSVLLE